MNRLKDKATIITGANSSIGKETTIHFAQEGANLALCARCIRRSVDDKRKNIRVIGAVFFIYQHQLTSSEY